MVAVSRSSVTQAVENISTWLARILDRPEKCCCVLFAKRERQRLVKERTSLTNSIKGLLKLHGIFDVQPRSKDFEAKFADVATAYESPLPPRARQEILQIAERLALVEEQIARVEAERNAFVLSGEATSMVDAPEGSQARARLRSRR